MIILVVYATLDALIVVTFAASIGLTLLRFRRSAHEAAYDAAAGTSPLRGPR